MKTLKAILIGFILISFVQINKSEAKPKLVFGTRSHPGASDNCEGDRGICIIIHGRIVNDDFDIKDLGDDMGLAEIEIVDGELKMNILFDNSKNCFDRVFHVIKDVSLDEEVCEALGYRHVVIQSGKYGVDFSRFRYGAVEIPVEVR